MAGYNTIVIDDSRVNVGSDPNSLTLVDVLADIAADVYGFGVPTGSPNSIVFIEERRALVSEQVTLPPGVFYFSSVGTVLLADLSGATPGIILSEGSGIDGFYLAASATGGTVPMVKVDLSGASGAELPTQIRNNRSGSTLSSIPQAISVEGGHADSQVNISDMIFGPLGADDLEIANDFIGSLFITNSFMNNVTGVAGGAGYRVVLSASRFEDLIFNTILTSFNGHGCSADTLTFAAVANGARTVGMLCALTDNSTAGVLTDLRGGGSLVTSVNTQTGVVVLDADDIDDTATTNKYVTAGDITNLGNLSGTNAGDEPDASATVKGIVELAVTAETDAGTDLTRAVTPGSLTNVLSDITTLETLVASSLKYKGSYDAATNTPDLDTTPIATEIGDTYTVTVAGVFFTANVEIGDVLISEAVNATTEAEWTIVNKNIDAASVKTLYESNADTNAFTDAEQTTVGNQSGTNTGDEVAASTTAAGVAEISTVAEIDTGTDNVRTISPLGLAGSTLQSNVTTNNAKVSADGSVATHSDVSAAQATAIGNLSGTNSGDEVAATEGTAGVAEIATTAETGTGTDDARIITPLKLAEELSTQAVRMGWAVPGTDDAVATEHNVISTKADRLSAVTVDGVPTTQNHVDSNTAPILVNITTMTSSGTLRLTGTSWDTDSSSETGADTEDLVISGTGYVVSTKHWRGTVVLSSVGGLDVVLDSFMWDPLEMERDVQIQSIQIWYKSTAVSNTSRMVLQRFNPSTGFTTLIDETLNDISSLTPGSHHHTSKTFNITESSNDRLYFFIETKRIEDVHFEIHGVGI